MSQWWAVPMLLSGGLFVGGMVAIAWERVPTWRASDPVDFRSGFAHTLRRVDRLQPALLVVGLGSTIGFASSAGGAARTLAALAAGGFLVVLVGSVAVLVPIQRRLVASGPAPPLADLEALRTRWCGGHLVRSAVALACFALAVVATPRAGRPIRELPGLGTVDGVADLGLALAAWFTDPTTPGSVCSSSRSRSGDRPGHPGSPRRAGQSTATAPAPDRRQVRHPQEGDPGMTGKRLFTLNGVIAGGYGLALLVATGPILDGYGITPTPKGPTWPAGSGRSWWPSAW